MSYAGMNTIAILVAAIAGWLFGAIWYGVLGKQWVAALGKTHSLGLSDGADFGARGWLRLNFGCVRATLDAALALFAAACRAA